MQASSVAIEVPQHEPEEAQRLVVDELAAVLGTQAHIRPVQPGGMDVLPPDQMYEAVGRIPSGPTVRVRAVLSDGHDLYDSQRDTEWPVLTTAAARADRLRELGGLLQNALPTAGRLVISVDPRLEWLAVRAEVGLRELAAALETVTPLPHLGEAYDGSDQLQQFGPRQFATGDRLVLVLTGPIGPEQDRLNRQTAARLALLEEAEDRGVRHWRALAVSAYLASATDTAGDDPEQRLHAALLHTAQTAREAGPAGGGESTLTLLRSWEAASR